ncbi:hypothetical protein BDV30DRAFT_201521 [Aspergillus minisclerotigenes]|uniref:Uncharacterized protein n=1 Tax=Aspergillus minisclerotigenes TaxID=656917 RepID=A0A5N6JKH2_9EURO|nr:hypothetical protein BDV30DRAFT_201521 [Aspergillus minisclerotigenes]
MFHFLPHRAHKPHNPGEVKPCSIANHQTLKPHLHASYNTNSIYTLTKPLEPKIQMMKGAVNPATTQPTKHQPIPFNRYPTSKIRNQKTTSANSQLTTKSPSSNQRNPRHLTNPYPNFKLINPTSYPSADRLFHNSFRCPTEARDLAVRPPLREGVSGSEYRSLCRMPTR